MATLARRLPANVPGDFYVDSSCIDCGACMWIAPRTFDEAGDQSRVHAQPTREEEQRLAEFALVACPTGSIGVTQRRDLRRAALAFPREFTPHVLHCGYHDESTFGATSWLARRAEGNVLVDVPRFVAPLVKRIEELGGVKTLFLTHRDDVGEQAKFAAHFGCERVIHRGDLTSETRDAERVVEGDEPVQLAPDLLVVPTPGHTLGSSCLLFTPNHGRRDHASGFDAARDAVLFTGDHLAWSDELQHPYAFRTACWFDWNVLKQSMRRLAKHRFEWILPGHGAPCHFAADEMRRQMARCVDWIEKT
jgi:glyoxylase-like metal-dependent hydrolase (beta-lactamase superfamily II)/ferredoxin